MENYWFRFGSEVKLELERIYEEYCMGDLGGSEGRFDEDEWCDMLRKFVKFRLDVSGGDKSNMSVSMFSVGNFLNEIFLFDNMMCDWGGCYRGDFSSECLDGLIGLLDESSLDEGIKEMIIKGYKDENGMDEE
jgi:hypothetical protein